MAYIKGENRGQQVNEHTWRAMRRIVLGCLGLQGIHIEGGDHPPIRRDRLSASYFVSRGTLLFWRTELQS